MQAAPKTKRIIDRKLLDRSHTARCVVCNRLGCDPAHIKARGSGGDDIEDNIIDFCRQHHSEQHSLGWARFAKKYPTIYFALNKKGWVINLLGRLVRTDSLVSR